MKLNKFALNGLFLTQRMTGVHRYASEIIKELDKIVPKDELTIIVPNNSKPKLRLNNIKIIQYGNLQGIPWEQIDYVTYLKRNKLISVNLCNEQPLFAPGVICIHDVAYKTHPQFFTTLHGRLSSIWHRLVFKQAAKSDSPILTVSHFSKCSIAKTYNINPGRIHIVSNAWQHIERSKADTSIIDKNGLIPGDFFFTLGNINANKNTKWVIEYAKKNPSDLFVLSGPKAKVSNIDIDADNVLYLGYLTDPEIKALYQNCKAFIFPSFHEGFGIPPLEALSEGAQVIVSNTTSLPEIFEDSAHYIDPSNTDIDLDNVLASKVSNSKAILEKYSWEKSARALLDVLESM